MVSNTWQQHHQQRERLARLRGAKLPETSPGARGIEHVQRNPACTALRTITMAGASPADVMSTVLQVPPREGQSPFAITTGLAFERHLADKGAAALFTLYRQKGRLGTGDARLVDLSLRAAPSSAAAKARHKVLTRQLLLMKLHGAPQAPHLIIKPRLAVSLLGVSHDVEPDALVASSQDRFYRVVELKSYADRDGETDQADIRGACRQAAVGVYALRETLTGLSIANPVLYVPAMADLVLRRPGSMSPTLRSMPLVGEYASITGVLATPAQDIAVLEALVRGIAPGATFSDRVVIDALPINYLPGCREHCPMAPYCKARALAAGDPSVLDPRYREVLAPAGNLGRAYALLDGTVTAYRSPQEQELADRLRAARDAWREAV